MPARISVRAGVCTSRRPILKASDKGARVHLAHRSIPTS
ncbi:hypothetical protein FOYG_11168 [Fusarium oxysporum NRRL 32931]|uniref:Uncharacterized protein n=1 Tax=Fusarium oxysporum NRRL 32931 TaxID=660029 RepID=W9I0G1_FUSOX|nr:hypothetical protein FOYG_11168 [Fusarium oxysporum NRRL 32931]